MSLKKFCLRAMLACTMLLAAQVHAQSEATGPIDTPAGALNFVRDEGSMAALIGTQAFDRFDAKRLVHFDDAAGANATVSRMVIQTDNGPNLYDFRRNPPLVVRSAQRMMVKRVFWQGEEAVLQSNLGWYAFQRGKLTKLQSSTSVYH